MSRRCRRLASRRLDYAARLTAEANVLTTHLGEIAAPPAIGDAAAAV